jgi:hypothetical protein
MSQQSSLFEAGQHAPESNAIGNREEEPIMGPIAKGFLAALAATIVLSAMMLMKAKMGLMPELDLPRMISGMMGAPQTPALGWAIHAMIGVGGYGFAMAFADHLLPGENRLLHGVIISVAGWLVMMIMLMPMVGAGFFGMKLGMVAPMMTLALHLVFGATLGWTYGRLLPDVRPPRRLPA